MTTIVYCHKTKQIACDSRSTVGSTIETDEFKKFVCVDGEVWFFAGASADNQSLIDIHNKKTPEFDAGCIAMVATKSGVWIRMHDTKRGRYMPYELTCSWAIGSGADHAITAIDLGLGVKDAVLTAMKRDTCTGGKIHVFDCLAMEFIG